MLRLSAGSKGVPAVSSTMQDPTSRMLAVQESLSGYVVQTRSICQLRWQSSSGSSSIPVQNNKILMCKHGCVTEFSQIFQVSQSDLCFVHVHFIYHSFHSFTGYKQTVVFTAYNQIITVVIHRTAQYITQNASDWTTKPSKKFKLLSASV